MLTQTRLKELLHYNPETGIWKWIQTTRLTQADHIAGCYDKRGRHMIGIDGKLYKSHRLAFLYMLGRWPIKTVDHDDTNPSNNKWSNLRDATSRQQALNRGKSKNNLSGFKNIYWNKIKNRWAIRIINPDTGKRISGSFACLGKAIKEVRKLRIQYHKEFARHV
jgi:hypothetical protein